MSKPNAKARTKTETSEMDMTASMRQATEQSIAQAQTAYDQIKASAEETTNTLEASFNTATKGSADFNRKILDAVRSNFDATFSFAQDLIGVKDAQEALDVQSKFVQAQYQAMTNQAQDITEFAGDIAKKAAQPIQENATKAFQGLPSAKQ